MNIFSSKKKRTVNFKIQSEKYDTNNFQNVTEFIFCCSCTWHSIFPSNCITSDFFVSLIQFQNLQLRFLHSYRHGCISILLQKAIQLDQYHYSRQILYSSADFCNLLSKKVMCPKVCLFLHFQFHSIDQPLPTLSELIVWSTKWDKKWWYSF